MVKTTFFEFQNNLFGNLSRAAFGANYRTDFGNNIVANLIAESGNASKVMNGMRLGIGI